MTVPHTSGRSFRYEPVPGWGAGLPDLLGHDISDIAVGPRDEVYLLYRDPSFVAVASPDGALQSVFAVGVLVRPHGIAATAGQTYVVDEGAHRVRVFDVDGLEVDHFGSGPSDPEFPPAGLHVDRITRALPPFNRPTRLAFGKECLFVSDGYGNCRVHEFDVAGRLLRSWGAPGLGDGEFRIPHDVAVDRMGRVLVCDRENDRIQVFDQNGGHQATWGPLQRPNAIDEGPDGLLYVAEGRSGDASARSSGIAVLASDGRRVADIRSDGSHQPGGLVSAHGLAVDSAGDLYVTECVAALRTNFPEIVTADRCPVLKLRRVDA